MEAVCFGRLLAKICLTFLEYQLEMEDLMFQVYPPVTFPEVEDASESFQLLLAVGDVDLDQTSVVELL